MKDFWFDVAIFVRRKLTKERAAVVEWKLKK